MHMCMQIPSWKEGEELFITPPPPVAKAARHLVMQMQIFQCFWSYKEWISKEMNNGND